MRNVLEKKTEKTCEPRILVIRNHEFSLENCTCIWSFMSGIHLHLLLHLLPQLFLLPLLSLLLLLGCVFRGSAWGAEGDRGLLRASRRSSPRFISCPCYGPSA